MFRCVNAFILGVLVGGAAIGLFEHYDEWFARDPTERARTRGSDRAAAEELALGTTLRFGEAIRQRDLAGFRRDTSDTFRRTFSTRAFEKAFSGFVEQQTNLLAVAGMTPILTTHSLSNDSDTLRLAGYFPTRPSRLTFDYSYTRVGADWRLSGISVNVAPQD